MKQQPPLDGKVIIIVLLLLVIVGLLLSRRNQDNTHRANPRSGTGYREPNVQQEKGNGGKAVDGANSRSNPVDELTAEQVVVPYVKEHGNLPGYYITKQQARSQGWNAAKGNLCDVLPGKAIGGDIFTNRQGQLPEKNGRTWYEADLNYDCGHRNADRIVFSSDRLVFVTHDHYKSFQQK